MASVLGADDTYDTVNFKAESLAARLNVNIALRPKVGRLDLKRKYHVEQYNLTEGYNMSPALRTLVPKGTPDYVEHGENYVERITRALYHFKQCALIGPSGTGKSVASGERVLVKVDGRLQPSSVDRVFDMFSRQLKVLKDDDGWETIDLSSADLCVMSFDRSTDKVSWRKAAAIARSYYKGDVLSVKTNRNRSVRATPGHSFITKEGNVKGGEMAIGSRVPVVEEVPDGEESRVLWDYVKSIDRVPYDGFVYDFQVPGTETFAAGTGSVVTHNTHITYLVSEIAGLPMWEINCGLNTSVYDLFGRFVGLGKENWVDGQIVSWCRYGGILYLDEANMMKQDVATRLNPLLDTRGHLVLNEKDNEVIPRHPNGFVIISMNPYSAEFAGTKPLNAAFRRRMSVWIDFDYLSVGNKIAQDEVEMVAKRSGVALQAAEKIIKAGAEMRRRYKTGDLPYAPSVGDLINWATLVADGLTIQAAAEETIVTVTSDDVEVQNAVKQIINVAVGGSPLNVGQQKAR